MLIHVTAEHIAEAKRRDKRRLDLAIDLAFTEAIREPVIVGMTTWHRVGLDERNALPSAATAFLAKALGGAPVEPFSFELPIPASP